ncbi:histidine kinase, partial [Streptomyces sp. NPDC003077]|uniref:histidine kinase n=1 Tax=Streptomyces sp. NPDC003077 TaxID=3154443 RepID=UPI0033A3E7A6
RRSLGRLVRTVRALENPGRKEGPSGALGRTKRPHLTDPAHRTTSLPHRDRILLTALALTVAGITIALDALSGTDPRVVLPALFAGAALVAVFVCRPRSRAWMGTATASTGAVLLLASLALSGEDPRESLVSPFVAAVLVAALLTATIRWAPRRQVLLGGPSAGLALAFWTLPYVASPSFYEALGVAAFWSLPVVGAAVVGGYPRSMARRRRQAVLDARRAQQLRLAHDLHDFVAHDVSGIVVQAQAARFVAERDPEAALAALERIERAGLEALATIDRTVRMLHDTDEEDLPPAPNPEPGQDADTGPGPDMDPAPDRNDAGPQHASAAPPHPLPGPREPLPGTDRLREAVRRFSGTGRTRARIDIGPGVDAALTREAAAIAHRVVVEALTNIRRHAPDATLAEVTLTLHTPAREDVVPPGRRSDRRPADRPAPLPVVTLRVTNDAGQGSQHPTVHRLARQERGGRGLPALAERVRAAGGTLDAGPYGDGWRLTATFTCDPGRLPSSPATSRSPSSSSSSGGAS